jgi:hypothetical protein
LLVLLAPQDAQRGGVERLDLALLANQHDAVGHGVLNGLQKSLLLFEKSRLPAKLAGHLQHAQVPRQVGHDDDGRRDREHRGRKAPSVLYGNSAHPADHLVHGGEQDKQGEYEKAAAVFRDFTPRGDESERYEDRQ